MDISSTLLAYSAPAWASFMAGAFLILTLSLSLYLVFDHLSTYKNPEVFTFSSSCYFYLFICFNSPLSLSLSGANVFDWSHPHGPLLFN